jgi:hypothetical protein
MATPLLLTPDVYFCQHARAFVFLDLRQDEYKLVDGRAADALNAVLTGTACSAQIEEALRELVEGRLLTTDARTGLPILPTQVQMASDPLLDPDASVPGCFTFHESSLFVAACVKAAIRLRFARIVDTVHFVSRRRAQHNHQAFDLTRARELTSAFHRLRLLFPRDYLCLFDSLALLEFLAMQGVFPGWIFGVKLEPWAAHCWVQEAGFLFNDSVEEIADYTPVMAV